MRGINVVEKDYAVFINNPNQFLAISDFTVGGGINVVENVNIIESTEALDSSKQSSYQEKRQYIAQETESLNYFKKFYPGLGVYTFMENDLIIQDFTDKLKVANSPKGFHDAKINISNVVYINKVLSKKDLIKVFKRVTKAKTKYLASLNLPLHINNILNNNDFLAVLGAIPKNEDDGFDDFDIDELNIEKVVQESVDEAFKRFDLTFGILDYLVSEGILIGDMIEAGLALVDDADVTDELKEKMETQLLKSLSDINIIALLMAAIRTEEDFTRNNIREINIDENQAHFYADELLGLSIANQIAGTKAAFNFKLYKEVKPGIIYGLPPMLDDVFAGLIAGCMTKILQE
ncbi:phosphatidylglycerophosphatase A [uncultured Methanobrevibacter sp.]|uniref:phosphatidylglycerophosphatase A n=1 Tax=uncultured Methanobrevibacter sp. TaxID=253161 RepID=UPI0025D9B511|nr:phosphatidylglycerophosphatase A [uncultured Methanobrevibacter sp.]